MPVMTGVAETDRLAVLDDVRDDQHLRITRQLELMQHVNLQRAEAATEGNLLIRRNALIAKHQHVMIQMRAVNACEILLAQRLAEIETQNFSADGAVERANFDAPGLIGMTSGAGGGGCNSSRHRKLFVESVRRTPAKAKSDEFTGACARRQRSKSDTFICWSDKPDA